MALTLTTPTVPTKTIKTLGNVRVDVGDVTELAASIKATGLHQPLEVLLVDDVPYVIDGHRRLAALRKLRIKDTPVHVTPGENTDEARVVSQLVANMQRVDLTPLEEAAGYAQLKAFGWKQSAIAKSVGRSAAHVSKRLALLDLPDTAIDLAESGRLGPEGLYALSQVASAGGDVDVLVATLVSNNDDGDPIDTEEVETMAKAATERARLDAEIDKRRTEYEDKGVTTAVAEVDNFGHVDLPKDRIGYGEFDLDHDDHLLEPCALMVLWHRWGSVLESQHCTDRRRHDPETGVSSLKLKPKPRQTSTFDEAAARSRRRGKALNEAATAIMEGRAPARDKVVDRLIVLYLDRLSAYSHNKAAKLLGVEAELKDEYKGLSRLYEDADQVWRVKILLAATLAHGHELSAGAYVNPDESHFDYLAELGHPIDLEAIEKAVTKEAEVDQVVAEAIAEGEADGV